MGKSPRQPLASHLAVLKGATWLLEQDLGHHAFVLVIQQMTMEY